MISHSAEFHHVLQVIVSEDFPAAVHCDVQLLSWSKLGDEDVVMYGSNAGVCKHICLVPNGDPLYVLGTGVSFDGDETQSVRQDFILDDGRDHQYALDPVMVKEKWFESQEKMEQLRQELRKAKDRERRQRQTVSSLLEDLKKNKMLTEEPEQKLDFYSGGWNNSPSVSHFLSYIRHTMVQCGITPTRIGIFLIIWGTFEAEALSSHPGYSTQCSGSILSISWMVHQSTAVLVWVQQVRMEPIILLVFLRQLVVPLCREVLVFWRDNLAARLAVSLICSSRCLWMARPSSSGSTEAPYTSHVIPSASHFTSFTGDLGAPPSFLPVSLSVFVSGGVWLE
ncbi:hypothetical protein INR49_023086 [Caranx melampygus]|nr:hypothetical protein INR49_023086 [Caranx melampygus]